jgi:hypothetical protein
MREVACQPLDRENVVGDISVYHLLLVDLTTS